MRKQFMALMLTLFNANSMAEWIGVSTPAEEFQLYADASTITASYSNRVKMWDLMDYKTMVDESDIRFSSTKNLREYDCEEGRYRDAAWMWFSGNMGEGEVVVSYLNNGIPDDWHILKPDSKYYSLLEVACAGQKHYGPKGKD